MKSRFRIRGVGTLFLIMLLPVFSFMYACGGGGGGGGGTSNTDINDTGINYTGLTTQTAIDDTNAVSLAKGAYTGGKVGNSLGSIGAVQEIQVVRPNYLQLSRAMEEAIRQIDVHAPPGVVELGAIVTKSDSIPGSCGGTASYTVQANDATGEFSGSMNFNSYCSEETIINGAAEFSGTINIDSGQPIQFTLNFDGLTATLGTDSITLDGNFEFIFLSSTSFTATMDMRQRDNSTEKVYWVDNYVMDVSVINNDIQFEVSGTFYDPDYGYVVLSTPTPFLIDSGQNWPSQGVMICTGKDRTKARLTVVSSTTYEVEADTNGDDTYEWNSGNLNWQ